MDMREVAIGSKVRLRDGREGILRSSKTFSGIGLGVNSVYDIRVGGMTVIVWEDGGFHKGCGESGSDVIGVVEDMDMSKLEVGARVRLRDGGVGVYKYRSVPLSGGCEVHLYEEVGSGDMQTVWCNGRISGISESPKDVIGVVGSEDKREGEEYLERLNELSTENIVLGRVIDKVLGRVSGGSCAVVLGERCSGCMVVDRGERVKCLRDKLEGIEKVVMREEVSCG
jgi:hypothetical protein